MVCHILTVSVAEYDRRTVTIDAMFIILYIEKKIKENF